MIDKMESRITHAKKHLINMIKEHTNHNIGAIDIVETERKEGILLTAIVNGESHHTMALY